MFINEFREGDILGELKYMYARYLPGNYPNRLYLSFMLKERMFRDYFKISRYSNCAAELAFEEKLRNTYGVCLRPEDVKLHYFFRNRNMI